MIDDDRKAFWRTFRDRPKDAAPRLAYADWLAEQGDPLSSTEESLIRELCKPANERRELRRKLTRYWDVRLLDPRTPGAIRDCVFNVYGGNRTPQVSFKVWFDYRTTRYLHLHYGENYELRIAFETIGTMILAGRHCWWLAPFTEVSVQKVYLRQRTPPGGHHPSWLLTRNHLGSNLYGHLEGGCPVEDERMGCPEARTCREYPTRCEALGAFRKACQRYLEDRCRSS